MTSIVEATRTRPNENTNEWDKSNAKAMVSISSTVESSQLEYLLTCETAVDMWKRLYAVHEQKSDLKKLLLMTKFHDYKMAANDSIVQHVEKIENMARQLKDIGENISNITLMAKVLGSLPAKFGALVTAWDSVDANNQTLENLTQRLIKEEGRMNAIDEVSGALAAISVKSDKEKQSNQERQKTLEKKMQRSRKEVTCFIVKNMVISQRSVGRRKKSGIIGIIETTYRKMKEKTVHPIQVHLLLRHIRTSL